MTFQHYLSVLEGSAVEVSSSTSSVTARSSSGLDMAALVKVEEEQLIERQRKKDEKKQKIEEAREKVIK